jgi:hypothetical protein
VYVTDLRRWAAAAAASALAVTGLTAASGSAHATPEAPRPAVTGGWYGDGTAGPVRDDHGSVAPGREDSLHGSRGAP